MPQDERSLEYMPLPEIARAPRNPKKHDAEGIDRSIRKFGFVELPALDERTGRLVAGHGRIDALLAAAAHQQTPPKGVKLADDGTWLVPVLRGWASQDDAHAEAYLVGSNQLTIAGGWDETQLAQLLDDLSANDDQTLLEVTGFDDSQLDQLLQSTDSLGGPAGNFLSGIASQPFGEQPAQPAPQGPPTFDWSQPPPSDDGPDEGEPAPAPQLPESFPSTPYGPAGTAAEYAPMSWVLHSTARETIRAALKHIQQQRDIATTADALTALCSDYCTANGLPTEQLETQQA